MLVKFRLSLLVVFSSAIGYLFAVPTTVDWFLLSMICLGGFFTTAASNALNQVIEKDFDALMSRTSNRPLPTSRMTAIEALLIAGISAILGIGLLWIYFNQLAALFAAVALISYAFIYTPLKRISPVAVFIGAIPGALPPLIGYVAATNQLDQVALILFGIQFFWQFPHFWAIAWVAHQDYSAVGFRLLPSREGPTRFTAMQTIAYSLLLVPVTLLPFFTGLSTTDSLQGLIAIGVVILANVFMIGRCINLYRTMEVKAARRVMFGSYLYLPLILFALLLSKATTA